MGEGPCGCALLSSFLPAWLIGISVFSTELLLAYRLLLGIYECHWTNLSLAASLSAFIGFLPNHPPIFFSSASQLPLEARRQPLTFPKPLSRAIWSSGCCLFLTTCRNSSAYIYSFLGPHLPVLPPSLHTSRQRCVIESVIDPIQCQFPGLFAFVSSPDFNTNRYCSGPILGKVHTGMCHLDYFITSCHPSCTSRMLLSGVMLQEHIAYPSTFSLCWAHQKESLKKWCDESKHKN